MKHIVITGVSTGIGNVTARYLADKGYHIIGTVRKSIDAQKLSQDLGDRFTPLILDVRDQEAIDQAILELLDSNPNLRIEALINNAGVAVSGPLHLLPIEELEYQLDVNVLGLMRMTQAFLPLLGASLPVQKPLGRIINIGSISGLVTKPFVAPYSASKYAVEALSDGLRRELAEVYGLKVVLIEPGPVKTPIWEKARQEKPRFEDSDYAPFLKNRAAVIKQNEDMAIEVIDVAKLIHHAITTPRPKARYLISKNKWLIKLMANVFPDAISDKLFKADLRKALKS